MTPLLTVREVADLLRISMSKVYVLAARGELPCLRVGKSLRFPLDAIERWVAEQTEYPSAREEKAGSGVDRPPERWAVARRSPEERAASLPVRPHAGRGKGQAPRSPRSSGASLDRWADAKGVLGFVDR